jgi:hypothetical protein
VRPGSLDQAEQQLGLGATALGVLPGEQLPDARRDPHHRVRVRSGRGRLDGEDRNRPAYHHRLAPHRCGDQLTRKCGHHTVEVRRARHHRASLAQALLERSDVLDALVRQRQARFASWNCGPSVTAAAIGDTSRDDEV